MSERALKPNTIINEHYVIENVIGEGGFGITYRVRDTESDTEYAVKEYFPLQTAFRSADTGKVCVYGVHDVQDVSQERVISGRTEFVNQTEKSEDIYEKDRTQREFDNGLARFQREAEVLQEYRYLKGIVRVCDTFLENNTAYIVMEYIDGITLKNYVSLYGGFEYDELIDMLTPIMKSLATLHRHGLIHRDISPDNIMIGMDNEVYLIDFGSAKEVEPGKTATVLLKAGYAPPEQYLYDGKLGAWTDVYGLCGTIYTALGGGVPIDAVARLQGKELISLNDKGIKIADWQWRAIEKGMSIRTAERLRDMVELLSALTIPPNDEDIVTVYGDGNEEIRQLALDSEEGDTQKAVRSYKVFGLFLAMALVLAGGIYAVFNSVNNRDADIASGVGDNVASDVYSSEDGVKTSEEYGNEDGTDTSGDNDSGENAETERLCEMPDVTGMSNSEAYKTIREADGKIHINTRRSYSDDVPSGIVISQDVEPATRYNEGAISEVTIMVSMGTDSDKATATDSESGNGSTDNGGAGNANNTNKSNTNNNSKEKDYNVKSDGNESVDFYLDD